MPRRIPFVPSKNNYRLNVPLDGTRYLFDNIHWNAQDHGGAWFLDLREEDESPILLGIKLVLGARIGISSTHPFFQSYFVRVVDTAGQGIDAGYDDLGARIQLVITSLTDALAA